MSQPNLQPNNINAPRKHILTINLGRHLTGQPIASVLAADWSKANAEAQKNFENQGFDVDFENFDQAMVDLQTMLRERPWDGLQFGWFLHGKPAHTAMFERVVAVCVEEIRRSPETKIMFSTGPEDLVETTSRNFLVQA